MADDEDYDQPQVTSQQAAVNRPERRVRVCEHDTPKDRTDEIVELAQTVLDTLAAQRLEQLKNDASGGVLAAAAAMAAAEGGSDGAVGGRGARNSAVAAAVPAGGSHKDVATALKRKLDETLGGTWHVIVGQSFGGNITSDEATLVNFVIDGVYFLVLRSGPPERPAMLNAGEDNETK